MINQASETPWVGIARDDAREWWREHPGAPFAEFDAWVFRRYEPFVLAGTGHVPGQPLTPKLREILDQAHQGLVDAAAAESKQRLSRVA